KSSSTGGARTNTADAPSPPAVEKKSGQVRLDEHLRRTERAEKTQSRSRRATGAKAALDQQRGRYTRAVSFKSAGARIAIDATLRALAGLDSVTGQLTPVSSRALRYKLLKHKQGTLFVFAIDASGSMAANRIARAKSTILKLLRKSYLNRDSVAIVSFHGTTANVDLPPSRSILRARRVLDSLRMGGSTPLGAGLVTTIELIELVGKKFGETVVLLFTDGRSNVPLRRNGLKARAFRQLKIEGELHELKVALRRTRARVVVVDTQKEFESSEETRRLAEILHARFVKVG
ncbi:MAG TPA: VWA domain-containing protein, partial [Pyrinomonadaceae bacterium]|nr:VWA domain-containing protein [Pyrinomonadaceae bacterium]